MLEQRRIQHGSRIIRYVIMKERRSDVLPAADITQSTMPIVAADKKQLKVKDVAAIKMMLRQSFQSHITYLNEKYEQYTSKNVKKTKQVLLEAFTKAVNSVDADVDKANRKWSNVRADQFINDYYENLMNRISRALDKIEMNKGEISYVQGFISEFGIASAREYADSKLRTEDTDEGYSLSESTFHLPDKPVKGIEDIDDYNPNTGRVQVLYEARSGNSGTLEANVQDRMKELEDIPEKDQGARNFAQQRLQETLSATAGLHAGGEIARIYSSELMNKDSLSFGDLYEVFSGLNRTSRVGDKEGGNFRAEGIMAGKLSGVGSFTASKVVYKTLSRIADCMNEIRKTEDPALRKTQAIQLASFAYAMTISEHVFMDGNGRTCRLFADTILQTFGLPPHTPLPGLMNLSKTLGSGTIDFSKGAEVFFEGIKLSNESLRKEKKSRENEGQKREKISLINLEDRIDGSEPVGLDEPNDNLINDPNLINTDELGKGIALDAEKKQKGQKRERISLINLEDSIAGSEPVGLDESNDNLINNPNRINTDESGKRIALNVERNLNGGGELRYTGNPEVPDLSNINQVAWLKKLGKRAEQAKGRVFDSEKYKEFLQYAGLVSDLAEQFSKKNGLDMTDEAIIPTANFADKTRELFGNDSFVTAKRAKEVFAETWKNLAGSAKAYEKFKVEDEGYTRDVRNKNKHQLKEKSKQKFELMDEIFEPQKRKAPTTAKKK